METDVVAAVVRVVTEFASGAAGAAGANVGQAVSVLVRQRLGTSPSGQAALAAVDAQPEDAEARTQLAAAISAAGAEDPDFAARLVQALAGPPPAAPPRNYVGSVVIDGGASVRKSTIALGPVTFSNTPSGRAALVALAAALLALVVLGVYGGARLFDGDSSPGSGAPGDSAGGPGAGRQADGTPGQDRNEGGGKAVPLSDAEAVKAVLPDAASLPSGWTEVKAPKADVSSQDDGSTFEGGAEYQGRYSMDTEFLVFSYPGESEARSAFERKNRKAQAAGVRKLTMPSVGDEITAFSQSTSEGAASVIHTTHYTMVRTGTVLTIVSGKDNESRRYDSGDLESLTRLLSQRARTAQTG
ncbi:hypothetical protein [Streptomyces sp. NPDC058157]|uniref:hypothetical protein n=1 Tax=Streptomyces sp. NPDC058157 TaxID=3346360 RepID=UPI0036EA0B19